jgi:membrane protease YdiL (CAAX protease family)
MNATPVAKTGGEGLMATTATWNQEAPATLGGKALILLAVVVAYGSNFWPGRMVLAGGLKALGNPQYHGPVGIFLPHLLLYSTLMAAVSAVLWWTLVRARLLRPPQFGNVKASAVLGLIGGLAALALSLIVIRLALPAGTIHWIAPDPWKIAGNVFSNFYEEFVFRGFVLLALRRLVGFWPAAVVSSAMWAFTHVQFPLTIQLTILVVGVGFCWIAQRARSLLAPYFAHEVLDLLGDSLIG